MKVDWFHPDTVMSFDAMAARGAGFPSLTVLPPGATPGGGQYYQAVPKTLGTVTGNASIHTDKDDGTRYVRCGGTLSAPSPSVEIPRGTYWPYEWAGWPVLAAIPGDLFNAQTSASDPDYEYGGKYIESGMIAKLDPDATEGPWLQNYNTNFNPPIFEDRPHILLGNSGAGGTGGTGGIAADGTRKQGWNFRAVSQRCWVLIVIDPSGHRTYEPLNPGDPTDIPIVLQPQGFVSYRFELYWRLGAGSGIPGLGSGNALSNKPPSSVHIG